MFAFIKSHKLISTSVIASIFLYVFFSYELIRGNFTHLITSFSFLFALFLFQYKRIHNWKTLLLLALVFRLIFLFATPNLSQDFYRFIWDGRMLLNGYNPYLYLPIDYLSGNYIPPNQAKELVAGMQELNASNYSNYPPLNQLCFYIAALLSNKSILGSIIVMRLLLILADIGVFYFGSKLLKRLNLNPKLIFLYLLNPFIIIELVGNLHFEGIMIFFLSLSLYLLAYKKWLSSAIFMACSIQIKLLPLLFLPLLFKHLDLKKLIGYYALTGTICISLFIPFISQELFHNYSQSVGLWFGNFEFNGSFHNIIKHIGNWFNINHTTQILGKTTPLLVITFISYLSLRKKNTNLQALINFMVFGLCFYLFTSSTVHPWYVAMLLALSVFTSYRFPLVWSFSIMLSYSFYNQEAFQNNYWLLSLEYILVFAYMIYEFLIKKNPANAGFISKNVSN